jgi:phospholipase C
MAIEHVVILMLENRSFDEYFGTFPGANGFYNNPMSIFANAWLPSPGGWTGPAVLPYRMSTFSSQQGFSYGCNHGWGVGGELDYFAGGAMNGWSLPQFNSSGVPEGSGVVCMGYFAADDIPYHWWLAQHFALCDNYFCSCMGPTTPNRLYMFSGTIGDNQDFAGNPTSYSYPNWEFLNGGVPNWQSYADLLSIAVGNGQLPSPGWRLYDLSMSMLNPPDFSPPYTGSAAPGTPAEMMNPAQYFASWPTVEGSTNYTQSLNELRHDLATAGSLPVVSWIIPSYEYSEHPQFPPWDGAQLISQVLETLLSGPNWQSTVFIITYDETDGHFDHVPPPQPTASNPEEFIDQIDPSGVNLGSHPIGAGFRVPTLVISPWTFGRGVCNDQYDHTSILMFLEEVTGVPCINLTPGGWRRKTFKSLSTIGFNGPNTTASKIPARPNTATLASNAFSRSEIALATPRSDSPTGPPPTNTQPNGWAPSLTPDYLVPVPQTWPPAAQHCRLVMKKHAFTHQEVVEQAKNNGTGNAAIFHNAAEVVVEGYEPLELATPYALEPLSVIPSVFPPDPGCSTRIPVLTITRQGGAPEPNISIKVAEIDFDPNSPANQTQSGVPRTFTFKCSLIFQNIHGPHGPFAFGAHSEEALSVHASFQVDVRVDSSAKLELRRHP